MGRLLPGTGITIRGGEAAEGLFYRLPAALVPKRRLCA